MKKSWILGPIILETVEHAHPQLRYYPWTAVTQLKLAKGYMAMQRFVDARHTLEVSKNILKISLKIPQKLLQQCAETVAFSHGKHSVLLFEVMHFITAVDQVLNSANVMPRWVRNKKLFVLFGKIIALSRTFQRQIEVCSSMFTYTHRGSCASGESVFGAAPALPGYNSF